MNRMSELDIDEIDKWYRRGVYKNNNNNPQTNLTNVNNWMASSQLRQQSDKFHQRETFR